MPVAIRCSGCRQMLQVREVDLGKMVRCPSCGQAFSPRLDANATLAPSAMPDFELSRDDQPAHTESRLESDRSESPRQPQGRRLLESEGDTYAVELDADAAAPPRGRDADRVSRRRRRRISRSEEEDDDVQPHRGVLILVLGILSIVLSCIPLAGWILGGVSMAMGSHDEKLMEARAMDRSGRAMTKAGLITGIIGVFLATVWFIVNMVSLANRLR